MYKPTRHSYEKRMKNQRRKAKAGLLLATTLTAGMAVNPWSGSYRISVLFDRNRKCIRGTGGRDTQHQQRECDEDQYQRTDTGRGLG